MSIQRSVAQAARYVAVSIFCTLPRRSRNDRRCLREALLFCFYCWSEGLAGTSRRTVSHSVPSPLPRGDGWLGGRGDWNLDAVKSMIASFRIGGKDTLGSFLLLLLWHSQKRVSLCWLRGLLWTAVHWKWGLTCCTKQVRR